MMTYSAPDFLVYPELGSTNTELKRLLSERELAEHSVVITNYQTAGKGQVGNKWESEPNSNLTFSLLLKPTFLAPHLQFYISKAVSLALIDTIKQVSQQDATIKWPNDIYVNDSKVAGILIENSILGSALDYCIVGIGLNVNQEVFVSDAPNPVSLKQLTGQHFELEQVLELLLDNIIERYHQLETHRMALINDDYLTNLYRKEGTYSYRDDKETFEAQIASVNEMGLLTLVDTKKQKREYAFKEVQFVM
ncbi:biotin--[acetyl-CoA-carboxylase] ligase [Carboxylicivirga mesophila]|uniref:Biotin--[acetyl-CoA-carboxylase] ligase n=1 Tax=Carboxylicivirga mesophila TaxID=1166478 RepID=A0ABS5K6T5_9BACT|nr:biotin--[acetyl-CoA-carboxylase] ligase [Carboxylicivirga mesophila]MBS2210652.1 biotin--[acetyl-CoA-carboxylase] ligase [Carboxylicivirga mesophila]